MEQDKTSDQSYTKECSLLGCEEFSFEKSNKNAYNNKHKRNQIIYDSVERTVYKPPVRIIVEYDTGKEVYYNDQRIDAVNKIATFLIIFFCERCFSSTASKNNGVFMFLSGFLLQYIISYIIDFLICAGSDKFAEYVGQDYKDGGDAIEEISTRFIVGLEFYTAAKMLLDAGTIIMIWLHQKKLSSFIIWICVGCFFGPLVIEFIGICGVDFFYTYLVPISYIASPICGGYFYYSLQDDDKIPTNIPDQSPLV